MSIDKTPKHIRLDERNHVEKPLLEQLFNQMRNSDLAKIVVDIIEPDGTITPALVSRVQTPDADLEDTLILELLNGHKCVVMHVDRCPGNFRTVGCDQDLLDSMATNIANDDVLSAAGVAAIRKIGRIISRAITDKRHDRVNKTGCHDLAPLTGVPDRLILLIQQFKVAIGRPDMIIAGMFAFSGKDKFFGLTITREVSTRKNLLGQLTLIGIDDFRFGDDAQDIGWSFGTTSLDEPCQNVNRRWVHVQKAGPQLGNVLKISLDVRFG